MRRATPRPHRSVPGGTVFLTWNLARGQELLRPEERAVVLEVMARGDGKVGEVVAAVVMDGHVHVVVALAGGCSVAKVAQAWKSISSHRLTREHRRSAPVWQSDYFDRWIRSEERIRAAVAYVLSNPERRWPGVVDYPWRIEPRRYC